MLKTGCRILMFWSGLYFVISALILISVVLFGANSPLISMVFEPAEAAALDTRVIRALNALTILYNASAVVLAALAGLIIRNGLQIGKKWAFWALLIGIGFAEVMAFVASAPIGHARWQVNLLLSLLYLVGITLSGYGIFTQ